jgi:hypothetical protein
MNTPLEVMKAILDNGGPIDAWVRNPEGAWNPSIIRGVDVDHQSLIFLAGVKENIDWYDQASLTDPNKKYAPIPTEWTHDWARFRALDDNGELWEFAEKPKKEIDPVTMRWISIFGVTSLISRGHDPSNWENSLEERPRKQTRPMTAREFARFVGENMGRYLYRREGWGTDDWTVDPLVCLNTQPKEWLYAENVPGELTWRELPEVSE